MNTRQSQTLPSPGRPTKSAWPATYEKGDTRHTFNSLRYKPCGFSSKIIMPNGRIDLAKHSSHALVIVLSDSQITFKSNHIILFSSIHILFNSYSSYSIHIILFNTYKHTVVFAEEWCSSVQIVFV